MRITHLRITCLLLISGVAGCTQQIQPEAIDWSTQQHAALQLTHWQLDGKLGIKSPQETGAMHIAWQQHDDEYDITLSGPLGSHATHLHGDMDLLHVEQGDDTYQGVPQELLDRALGWEFPIEHLRFWARGLPAPSHRAGDLQWSDGRLSHLTQSGWDITFGQYTAVTAPSSNAPVALPGRITAHHDDITLTFVVNQWTLPDVAHH